MRLIDADALLDRIPNLYERREVSRWVDKAKTVDAVPVVHGEWQEENCRPRSSIFYCSICHRTAYDIQPSRDKAWKKRCRYAYCPNCGARMDGKGNSNG